jgi:hypothetical protein
MDEFKKKNDDIDTKQQPESEPEYVNLFGREYLYC